MMNVLFGDVGVVPDDFLLEMARRSVMHELADDGANNPLEGLEHRARPHSLNGIGPVRVFAEIHRVVISVGEPEPNRYPPGRLETQRIDQLFAKESHRRRADDDDTLIVQPDNPLVRPKIEQFCEVQVVVSGPFVPAWLGLHDTAILWLESRIASNS